MIRISLGGTAGNINITATESVSAESSLISSGLGLGGINLDIFNLSPEEQELLQNRTGLEGNGGNIEIITPLLSLSNGTQIAASTSGKGNAGDITVNSTESIMLKTDTKLIVETSNAGSAGDILINTPELTIGENAELSATSTTEARGKEAIAGNINLNVNQLNIAGELGIFAETNSEANAGSLTIQPYQTNSNLNIQFTDKGFISARTTEIGDGGSITITAPEKIDIRGLGSITAETSGSGNAGNIKIDTKNLTIADSTNITTSTESSGNAGLITLNATESLNLTNQAQITSEVKQVATGTSEGITITTPLLTISDRSQISASTEGEGDAGDITVNANEKITLNLDTKLIVETSNAGSAGDILINTPELTIGENAELSARATEKATGNAGNIILNTNKLEILGDKGIFAETLGAGDAGEIAINAKENNRPLEITFTSGGNISASTSGSGDAKDITITSPNSIDISGNGSIKVETSSSGDAGSILIEGNQLNITDGVKISASTSGQGNSRNITLSGENINLEDATITALTEAEGNPGSIRIGNGSNNANQVSLTNSTISTEIQADGEAIQPANIIINTNNLALDASTITASTSANRDAGSITIPDADQINLSNNSQIRALTTGEGKAGNINLNVEQEIQIDSGSILNVETEGEGKAGDIDISADTITIGENAELSARSREEASGEAGNITLNANQLNISGELGIFAETEGVADAGELTINPYNSNNLGISFRDQGKISASTSGAGDGGNIKIKAPNLIEIRGNGIIKVETTASGDAGNININTNQLNIKDGVGISASTSGTGDSGNITLNVANLNLYQGKISALTTNEGNPGSILITNENNKANNINLSNSIISTEIQTDGEADQPANITINSDNLFLDKSTITSNVFGKGRAGEINLKVDDTILLENNSSISTAIENTGEGKGGNINIDTNSLFLNNGSSLSATTNGLGDAGNIEIQAREEIMIDNQDSPDRKGISTQVGVQGRGEGGSINIKTESLQLLNGGAITASSLGQGNAGNIQVEATDKIILDGQANNGEAGGIAGIIGVNAVGKAGNIELNTGNLTITNGAQITTNTLGKEDIDQGNRSTTIEIEAREGITISNDGKISSTVGNENINDSSSNSEKRIIITTSNLELRNNGEITTETFATGNPGSILIRDAQNISLDNNSIISTAINRKGRAVESSNIVLESEKVSLNNQSQITASTSGQGDAGNISIDSKELKITESRISALTRGVGNRGRILIENQGGNANQVNLINAAISTEILADGDSKTPEQAITIKTDNLTLEDESKITASTTANRDAGNIEIPNAQRISLDNNSEISAFTTGSGKGGKITIVDAQQVTIDNSSKLNVETEGEGIAGDIDISADKITIGEDGELSARSKEQASGEAGNITLNANQLEISGELGIFAETEGVADAGNLTINPDNSNNLEINFTSQSTSEGKISALTSGAGDGGNIKISAPETINISGQGSITAETEGEGNAGEIEIETNNLNLSNGVTISTEIKADGDIETQQPPNITLKTDNLSLDQSTITASTSANRDAGNINIPNAQQVTIDGNSILNVETDSVGNAGNIEISADTITIGENSQLNAKTTNEGNAGGISLETNQLNITGELGIIAETQAEGDAGNLNIEEYNRDNLEITFTNEGKISALTSGAGDGGNIKISAPETINISGKGSITAETSGSGNAGGIEIETNNLNLTEGVEISASTTGSGNAGEINLTASEFINLSNGSEISSAVEAGGRGNSKQITLNTPKLTLTDASQISAATEGLGNAGRILIPNAVEVFLDGKSSISTAILESGIATQPSNIQINTQRLTLSNDSEITASTSGQGDTGRIDLNASEFINLANQSEISSAVNEGGRGDSEQITLNTPNLNLTVNSEISAATAGEGNAGTILIPNATEVFLDGGSSISTAILETAIANDPSNIQINTQRLTLSNDSEITASTSGQGDTGRIDLNASEFINLSSGSEISSAVNEGGRGDSEQITLNTPNLNLTGKSEISAATAGEGNAGTILIPNAVEVFLDGNSSISTAILETAIANDPSNIQINTQRLTLSNDSEITASTSGQGDTGRIDLNASEFINLANQSEISSAVNEGGRGDSEQITLNTPNLNLTGKSQISAATEGLGNAGTISIPNAVEVFLDEASSIIISKNTGAISPSPVLFCQD